MLAFSRVSDPVIRVTLKDLEILFPLHGYSTPYFCNAWQKSLTVQSNGGSTHHAVCNVKRVAAGSGCCAVKTRSTISCRRTMLHSIPPKVRKIFCVDCIETWVWLVILLAIPAWNSTLWQDRRGIQRGIGESSSDLSMDAF
jgi:hypothetical protein